MKNAGYFILTLFAFNLLVTFEFSLATISENTIDLHQEECSVVACTVGDQILWGYNFEGHEDLEPFIQFGDHITFEDGGVSYFGKTICATGRMSEDGPRDRYAMLTTDGLCMAYNSLPAITMYIDPLK